MSCLILLTSVVARDPHRWTAPQPSLVRMLAAASCNPHADADIPHVISVFSEGAQFDYGRVLFRGSGVRFGSSGIQCSSCQVRFSGVSFWRQQTRFNDDKLVFVTPHALLMFFSTSELTLITKESTWANQANCDISSRDLQRWQTRISDTSCSSHVLLHEWANQARETFVY
jgi:hypothetical protein